VREFLRRGFMVAITGSKFFGGPPFSGSLLMPPSILARIGRLALPEGLADYSSHLDWPRDLRAKTEMGWTSQANLGLGLRWIAALSEMESFFALPGDLRSGILAYFEGEVRRRAERVDNLHEILGDSHQPQSILPFVMTHPDGAPFSAAQTASVHARLRRPCAAPAAGDPALQRIFHLGQPVAIGPRTALRVCASAPMISEIAERLVGGDSLGAAFAQWGRDLDALFEKWRRLMEEERRP
jgi:hypothetical protein